MTYLPAKRKRERMNVRVVEKKESPRHRRFVRGHVCITIGGHAPHLEAPACEGPIQFCHIRARLPEGEQAGVSQKPHDAFGFPACAAHHKIQHALGEAGFESRYGVSLLKTALALARVSPDPMIKQKAQEVGQ
jgi:hypothetical protein